MQPVLFWGLVAIALAIVGWAILSTVLRVVAAAIERRRDQANAPGAAAEE